MAQGRFINIDYPFSDSDNGFLLQLNNTDSGAIKADLMHLILTQKGQRLYMPDFGTDLMKYIFEPADSKTFSEIKSDIKETVKKYIPNLTVNEITVNQDTNNEHRATIRIDYSISEDVFVETDFVVINI